jgi:hypothetical protein
MFLTMMLLITVVRFSVETRSVGLRRIHEGDDWEKTDQGNLKVETRGDRGAVVKWMGCDTKNNILEGDRR